MFVGHTALALAAKAKAPRTSLALLYAAAEGLDLLWPPFLLAGIEKVDIQPGVGFNQLVFTHYPWSHSLLMAIVWGIALGALCRWRGVAKGTSILIGLLVVSHWVLDLIVHVPDLPLWPGSATFGLGLWNSIPGTLIVEGGLFVAGIAIYLRATTARDRVGSLGLWLFLIIQTAMWASGPWNPPPPRPRALAWFALGIWLFVLWAWWIDRHREPRAAGAAT